MKKYELSISILIAATRPITATRRDRPEQALEGSVVATDLGLSVDQWLKALRAVSHRRVSFLLSFVPPEMPIDRGRIPLFESFRPKNRINCANSLMG